MREEDGWKTLGPPAPFIFLGGLCAALSVACLAWTAALIAGFAGGERSAETLVFLFLAPLSVVLFAYVAAYILGVRLRYGWQGVERIHLGRRSMHGWHEIEGIHRHEAWGPRLHLRDGRTIPVWEFLKGFNDFLEYARERTGVDDKVFERPDLPDF